MVHTATESKSVPARQFRKVNAILEQFDWDQLRLIAILQAIQEEYRYLPEPVLSYLATSLKIPRARIYGIATFYAHFSLEPRGKHIVKICDGTACHVNYSQPLIDLMQEKLKISQAKPTTDDLLFTLEVVSCVGACGIAPVLLIDERVYPQMSKEKLTEALDNIIQDEERE